MGMLIEKWKKKKERQEIASDKNCAIDNYRTISDAITCTNCENSNYRAI